MSSRLLLAVVAAALVAPACGLVRSDAATPRPTSSTRAAVPTTVAPTTTTAPSTTAPSTTAPPTTAPPTTAAARATTGGWCIGDSVMLRTGPTYFDDLPMCATVDAVVGRQMAAAPALAAAAAAAHPPFVVLHLGTNGPIGPADLDAALGALTEVPRVVIVTVQLRGSRGWEAPNNTLIRSAPARHPNVRVADWDAASEGRTGLIADAFGHPTHAGADVYAQVIASAL